MCSRSSVVTEEAADYTYVNSVECKQTYHIFRVGYP